MPQSRQPAAIMFTDIVGYTALMGNDEQKAFELLTNRKRIQQSIIKAHDGVKERSLLFTCPLKPIADESI